MPTCNFVIDNRVSVDVPGNHAINPFRYFCRDVLFCLEQYLLYFLGLLSHVLTPIDLGLLINYVCGYTRGYLYVHRFLVSYGRPIRLLVIASINIPKVFIRM